MPRLIVFVVFLALLACADAPPESTERMTEAEQRLRSAAARSQATPAPPATPATGPTAVPRPAPAPRVVAAPWREPGFSYGPAAASVSFALGRPRGGRGPAYGSTEARISGVDGLERANWVAAELSSGVVFFSRDGGLVGWQRIRRDGTAAMEVPGDGMSAVAVIPGKGLVKMARKKRTVERLDENGPDRRYDRVEVLLEGPLTADASASLPRPAACEGDPFSRLTAALLPGLCLTHPAEDAMRAPARDGRFHPAASGERGGRVQLTFGPVGPPWHRVKLGYAQSDGSDAPESIQWSVLADHAGAPAAMVQLLREALGEPVVTLSAFEGKPRGDSYCRTPVPASTTARWQFRPPPGFASVVVTASAPTGASAEEVLSRAGAVHFAASRAR